MSVIVEFDIQKFLILIWPSFPVFSLGLVVLSAHLGNLGYSNIRHIFSKISPFSDPRIDCIWCEAGIKMNVLFPHEDSQTDPVLSIIFLHNHCRFITLMIMKIGNL